MDQFMIWRLSVSCCIKEAVIRQKRHKKRSSAVTPFAAHHQGIRGWRQPGSEALRWITCPAGIPSHRRFVISTACSLMDLRQTLRTLAQDYRDALVIAMVPMHTETCCATIGPLSALSSLLEHTRPELDTFLRLQDEGMEFEEAYQQCLAEQGQDFLEACEVAETSPALLTHDTLVEFAALSQKGFARTPRELLVVAKWPDYVSAFLVSCRQLH